ncbi:MAG: hypothetical protein NTZ78_01000 [Candidatus Aureabacteria bacterium]|nr:hypothetical protein [Candidatus Auribacterota bacterium]
MRINRICFAACVVETTLSIAGEWKPVASEQRFWKVLGTPGLPFPGAFLTAAANTLTMVKG